MTFDARELSRYAGAPVEAFLFRQEDQTWSWTSADAAFAIPTIGQFTRTTISRAPLEHSREDSSGAVDVYVERTNPVAALFLSSTPPIRIALRILQCHRGDEASFLVVFVGFVAGASFKGSQATLHCVPFDQVLRRANVGMLIQSQCPHALYSPGCGVNPAGFTDTATLSLVDGVLIKSPAFALRPNGWYLNGRLTHWSGARSFVVQHVGEALTLFSVLPALAAGQEVTVTAGCDRIEAGDCVTKFNNRVNHAGFSRLPGRNPFVGRLA